MSVPIPIALWLQEWQIAQFLSADDKAMDDAFKGGTLANNLTALLFLVGSSVQWQYNNNNNDPNLVSIGIFLKQLIGQYANKAQQLINGQTATLPAFTGPSNESTTIGTPVTFSITPTGGTNPISYQWYRGGIPIAGATGTSYTLSNPQLTDNGALFSIAAANVAGSTYSSNATLTVTQTITGYLYYNAADPGPILRASSDPFTYQNNYAITHNSPISVTLPSGSTPNMFLIFKVPSTESAKTTWYNTALNNGNIPDSVFQTPVTFGGFVYYYTRTQVSMDITQPIILT